LVISSSKIPLDHKVEELSLLAGQSREPGAAMKRAGLSLYRSNDRREVLSRMASQRRPGHRSLARPLFQSATADRVAADFREDSDPPGRIPEPSTTILDHAGGQLAESGAHMTSSGSSK